ncbi:TetR/AcrR family transcriptional regulator [Cupriavidus neocaledonicus]|uniref:HTH tetR-type domain-containing protein n=1 Tax=Cupriavidus neocaledonicus TaxID=1040979 RepID=A0A375HL66_9BURK|nr:TetR/AcrR family transcriptional regulator [Cupriavidus neocaledonicus]SOZ40938.1 hypothetical protein CBM2605_U20010 [Cupriavidus neocaledonicus]SPD58988.1 protein of unknown function [Cupriavidus neocaledonicus]
MLPVVVVGSVGRIGFNACSVDDLVEATASLHRGSLYKAFGSKRGLFEKVLDRVLVGDWYRYRRLFSCLIGPPLVALP